MSTTFSVDYLPENLRQQAIFLLGSLEVIDIAPMSLGGSDDSLWNRSANRSTLLEFVVIPLQDSSEEMKLLRWSIVVLLAYLLPYHVLGDSKGK